MENPHLQDDRRNHPSDKWQILLDGEDITGLNITERARKGISFAFQQPVHFKGLTVKDLITIAAGKEMSVNESAIFYRR